MSFLESLLRIFSARLPDVATQADDGYYSWIVEIKVHPRWVAYGFNVTRATLLDALGFGVEDDLRAPRIEQGSVRVLSAPEPGQIMAEMGHPAESFTARFCSICDNAPCRCMIHEA